MKKLFLILVAICTHFSIGLQAKTKYLYAPSEQNPYGLANPAAPEQVKDFDKLIGVSNCKSVRKNKDQDWGDEVNMTWTFQYIMNGMGVQDSTLKADGIHSGSIRLFDTENNHWQVHYYTTNINSKAQNLNMWTGGKKDQNLVFYRDMKAPNGMDGFYRLSFTEITKSSFNWIGEWVDMNETITFPTWKITCKKQ